MWRGLPALPRLSAFPEMNLRLYVDYKGKPGVWFVSLDAANPLAVWGARVFAHLPYFHASMDVRSDGERIQYQSMRIGGERRVAFRATYWPTSDVHEAKLGTFEYFVTERYRLYTQDSAGQLLAIDVHHAPGRCSAPPPTSKKMPSRSRRGSRSPACRCCTSAGGWMSWGGGLSG